MEVDNIIISMATHKPRYGKLQKTINTIVNQSVDYKKFIINVQDDLTEDEFLKFKEFESIDNRIEVIKREAKWRSFNKYLHTYKEYPDSIIITCDDDIMYPNGYFLALYDEWKRNKDCIISHESNPVTITNNKIDIINTYVMKFRQRGFEKYLTGCCLFPPRCFEGSSIAIDDYDKFFELTNGTHDEMWLWVLSTLMGRQNITLDCTYSFDLDGLALSPDESSLCHINGKTVNHIEYVNKINILYGNKLMEVMKNISWQFTVTKENVLAYYGNMIWINKMYGNYNLIFKFYGCPKSIQKLLTNLIVQYHWTQHIQIVEI